MGLSQQKQPCVGAVQLGCRNCQKEGDEGQSKDSRARDELGEQGGKDESNESWGARSTRSQAVQDACMQSAQTELIIVYAPVPAPGAQEHVPY